MGVDFCPGVDLSRECLALSEPLCHTLVAARHSQSLDRSPHNSWVCPKPVHSEELSSQKERQGNTGY